MRYLFDIDGTLLLTGGAGRRALNRLFLERFGVQDAMRDVSFGGMTDPNIIAAAIEGQLGRLPEHGEIEELLSAYVPLFEHELANDTEFRLMPAVVSTLQFLAEIEAHIGIATGNIKPAADAKLTRAKLRDRFSFGGYGDDHAERAKLVSHAISRATSAHGEVDREFTIVVGDTPRDIQAARACGVLSIAVATGSYTQDELRTCGATAVFATLAELPEWHRRKASERES